MELKLVLRLMNMFLLWAVLKIVDIYLWFYKKYKNNFITNDNSLGRYWMEHPHFTLGKQSLIDEKSSEKFIH